MTANEYQDQAMRTAGQLHSTTHGLLVTALGLCGEAAELCGLVLASKVAENTNERLQVTDELGDVYWYVARGATALGVALDEVYAQATYPQEQWLESAYDHTGTLHVMRLQVLCGSLAEQVKKHIYHSHEWEQSKAMQALARILACCEELCGVAYTSRQAVWEQNIAKLKQRYPEGFSEERSRTRAEYAREQMD